jgi:outer membrane immunogenic protein
MASFVGQGRKMGFRNAGHWLVAAVFLSTQSAFAGDLPVKAPVAAIRYHDWSGPYMGVHAGYGGGMNDWTANLADYAGHGLLGGGQFGINKQLASLVIGLELDGSWGKIGGAQAWSVGGPLLGILLTQTASSKIDGLVTFAGRAGLAADRWFVYAKGGVALAHESHSINRAAFTDQDVATLDFSSTAFRVAPTLGFGTEYALGNNWTLKAEYDYVHLGSKSLSLNGTQNTSGQSIPVGIDDQLDQALHVIKLGANYSLGARRLGPTFAPVEAVRGFNWSGGYIGAQVGYGFGRNQWPDFVDPDVPSSGTHDVMGWPAGGNFGANAQAGVFVLGVEGEWMRSGIKGSTDLFKDLGEGASATARLESKIDWIAIASARAGFVVGDRLLVYGKGGIAFAKERHAAVLAQSDPQGSTQLDLSATAVHTGAVAGFGAEYALGGNWSGKIEYNYIKMLGQAYLGTGTQSVNLPGPVLGSIELVQPFAKLSQDTNLIKVGVNYHFNPSAARIGAR